MWGSVACRSKAASLRRWALRKNRRGLLHPFTNDNLSAILIGGELCRTERLELTVLPATVGQVASSHFDHRYLISREIEEKLGSWMAGERGLGARLAINGSYRARGTVSRNCQERSARPPN